MPPAKKSKKIGIAKMKDINDAKKRQREGKPHSLALTHPHHTHSTLHRQLLSPRREPAHTLLTTIQIVLTHPLTDSCTH